MEIKDLLGKICEVNASNLIITAGVQPGFKVSNKLTFYDLPVLSEKDIERLIFGIMKTEQVERFKDQKELDFYYTFEGKRFRVSVYFQAASIAVSIKKISDTIPSFKDLNLPDVFRYFSSKKRGLLIITGLPGSGKATTIASVIDYVNSSREVHIVSLEEQIAYIHKNKKGIVEQRELYSDIPSISSGLVRIMKQPPDVVAVSHLSDFESIRLALTIAENESFVICGMSMSNYTDVIRYIIEVFPRNEQVFAKVKLANVLECIVTQRLLPNINDDGFVIATEVLAANQTVKNLICSNELHLISATFETGSRDGMRSFEQSIKGLYEAKKIRYTTAIRNVSDQDKMKNSIVAPEGDMGMGDPYGEWEEFMEKNSDEGKKQ